MSKISIISPVYKAEAYLSRCLDSILAQTFKDWELILVDDGSPDRSGVICDEYAARDSRIKVIHKANGGVSAARQDGLDEATGEYVIHVDPDDWIEANMLEGMYGKALSDNADMVICDYVEDSAASSKTIKQAPSDLSSKVVFKELFHDLHGSCCNKLIRRSLFKMYGIRFPDGYTILEDLYVTAMLCSHDIRISYLPKAFYHYVLGENSNSLGHKYNHSSVESIMSFCRSFSKLWHERGLHAEEFFYKYCTKSFAYDSREYSAKTIRALWPEINSMLAREAIRNCVAKPWVMEVWLGQYFPRIIGRAWRSLVMRIKCV